MPDEPAEKDAPTESLSGESDRIDETVEKSAAISRRSYIAAAAATVGIGGAATAVQGATSGQDIVEAGADPTGNEPVNDILRRALSNNEAVHFPEGEYLVAGDLSIAGDDWTVTGNNATLLFPGGGLDLSGSGWTFDGFEVDFRQQSGFSICWLGERNWTFGNVVFRGTRMVDNKAPLFVPTVPQGSTGHMHDIYAHEGNADDDEDGKAKLMWHDGDMAGTLTIERMWAEHWSENTIYASDMAGKLVVRDSYFRNTNSGCIRGSEHIEAHGCTFVADGQTPGQWNEERKGTTEFKGMWCNFSRGSGNGVGMVRDCDFYYTYDGGVGSAVELDGPGDSITIDDSRFHATFDVDMIDGAGASMSKGGSGNVVSGGFNANVGSIGATRSSTRATSGSPPLPQPPELGTTPNGSTDSTTTTTETSTTDVSGSWNSLRIDGDGDDSTSAVFTFSVSGELEHLTPEDAVLQANHGVDGSTATEDVWSESEEYRYTGDITDFQIDGPATVYVDGEQTSIDAITQTATQTATQTDTATETPTSTQTDTSTATPTETTTETDTTTETTTDTGTTTELPHTIVVEGVPNDVSKYSFSVSDTLEKHESLGTQNANDVIDGTSVSGYVNDDVDAYRFAGELQRFELTGSATVQFTDGT